MEHFLSLTLMVKEPMSRLDRMDFMMHKHSASGTMGPNSAPAMSKSHW